MAQGIRYVCRNCGRTIEAWSDGNPYYFGRVGRAGGLWKVQGVRRG